MKGDLELRLLVNDTVESVFLREGDVYTLDRNIAHCPVRMAGTIGLVVESVRRPSERGNGSTVNSDAHC